MDESANCCRKILPRKRTVLRNVLREGKNGSKNCSEEI